MTTLITILTLNVLVYIAALVYLKKDHNPDFDSFVGITITCLILGVVFGAFVLLYWIFKLAYRAIFGFWPVSQEEDSY